MANSLHDQLLRSGLVDEKRLNKAKKEKYKQTKAQKQSKAPVVDEVAQAAAQRQAEKIARDRALDQQRKQGAEHKAVQAQIRQLIEMNRIAFDEDGVAYSFEHDKRVQRIFVAQSVRDQLARGRVAIVSLDERYALVPAAVAQKIASRDAHYLVSCHVEDKTVDEDDPYADYQVPDDLMW